MTWSDDASAARRGDPDAQERLREYFAPFVHGVLLARVPHHVAHRLLPGLLNQAVEKLPSDDARVGTHFVALARRAADAALGKPVELRVAKRALDDARKCLEQLRQLPLPGREYAVLRLVEGVPGEELCAVLALDAATARRELDDGVALAVRATANEERGEVPSQYLWSAQGKPTKAVARLETLLLALRFDPSHVEPDATVAMHPSTTDREAAAHRPSAATVEDEPGRTDAKTADSATQLVAVHQPRPKLRPDVSVDGRASTASRQELKQTTKKKPALQRRLRELKQVPQWVWFLGGAVFLLMLLVAVLSRNE